MRIVFALFAVLITVVPAGAETLELAPYKDDLFGYRGIVEQSKDKRYRLIAYDREIDMIDRDEIPRRKAGRDYVSGQHRWSRRVVRYEGAGTERKMFAVGERDSPKVTVIWLHGQGGNRFQGVNDGTFGGNFNRLQNLMYRNDSLLLSPDFADFGKRGTADITALIGARKETAPQSPIILACGSMGGIVCANLAQDKTTAGQISGILLLGSFPAEDFTKSAAFQRSVPLFIGHGAEDPISPLKAQRAFFDGVLRAKRGYPVRLAAFTNGSHGTPIRMVDWREELNWVLRELP
jgi:predicted esterase